MCLDYSLFAADSDKFSIFHICYYMPFFNHLNIFIHLITKRSAALLQSLTQGNCLIHLFCYLCNQLSSSCLLIDSGSFASFSSAFSAAFEIEIRSRTAFFIVVGVMLCSMLYLHFESRLLCLSIAFRIESVIVSAYITT